MACDCIKKIDAALAERGENTILETNWLGPARALIRTCKRDDKKRQKPKIMEATYCPFCGDCYEAPIEEDAA